MFVIQKITQRYDPVQDRIALTVQNAEARVLLLWITQRLTNRLAATLAGWLGEDLKTVTAGQPASGLQAWEQSAARVQMKPERPVDPAAAQGEALVSSVDLGRGPHGYTLTFKWGAEGAARLVVNPTELRQWLIIVHRQFDAAGWPKDAWPGWFASGTASGAPPTTRHLLH